MADDSSHSFYFPWLRVSTWIFRKVNEMKIFKDVDTEDTYGLGRLIVEIVTFSAFYSSSILQILHVWILILKLNWFSFIGTSWSRRFEPLLWRDQATSLPLSGPALVVVSGDVRLAYVYILLHPHFPHISDSEYLGSGILMFQINLTRVAGCWVVT